MWEMAAWGHRWGMQDLVGNCCHFWDPHSAGTTQGGSMCFCEWECMCACMDMACVCMSVHVPIFKSVSLCSINMYSE